MTKRREQSPAPTSRAEISPEDLKQFLASFLDQDSTLARTKAMSPVKKNHPLDVYTRAGIDATLRLTTLADLLEAKIEDVDILKKGFGKLEIVLEKNQREVRVSVQKNGTYLIHYYENRLQVGEAETQLGLRKIANWLSNE